VRSNIKRQTRGFAESPLVIFENMRARKMSQDFLIIGSGCAPLRHCANIHDAVLGAEKRGRTPARSIDAAIIKKQIYGCGCPLANRIYRARISFRARVPEGSYTQSAASPFDGNTIDCNALI
jgi:hypothetical protein